MSVHILLLVYICILGFSFSCCGQPSGKKNLVFVICSFVPIFLIQTFRAETVGLDTLAYINGYYRINNIKGCWEVKNWELGYVFLNHIIGKITNCNVQVFLGTINAIILIGIGYFILKNIGNKSAFWPVFFYITLNHYLTSMCSMRQYIAIAIGINIYTILNQKQSKKAYVASILLLVVAFGFHTTAFILISLSIICSLKKVNRKTIVTSMLACTVVFLCFDFTLAVFFKVFPKYYSYFLAGHSKFSGAVFGNIYTIFLVFKIFVLGCVFTLNPNDKKNKEIYILLLLSILGAAVSIMTVRIALVWRFGYYFDIFLLLLIPNVIYRIKKIQPILFLLLAIAGWLYYIFLLYTNSAGCVPYQVF